MDWKTAGRVVPVSKGEWDPEHEYKKLDTVTYNDKTYMAKQDSIGHEPSESGDDYWMFLLEPYLVDMEGASSEENGEHGLVPEPQAGDEDRLLYGDATWGHKLQANIVSNPIKNDIPSDGSDDETEYEQGYLDREGNFIPFITYDEVIKKSMIGDAEPSDVLIGKSFSNERTRGLSGRMPDYRVNSRLVVTNGDTDAYSPAMRKTSVNGKSYYEVTMPYGCWNHSFGESSALIPAEEKTVTPGSSQVIVEPTAGKVLSKVICKAAPLSPTQEKTITASRSTQTVSPDSGKLLSKVTVNKFPDATGTYTCGSNTGAASSNDMGAGNNYRYVNATNVYNKGKTDGKATTRTVIKSFSGSSDNQSAGTASYTLTSTDINAGYHMILLLRVAVGTAGWFKNATTWPNATNIASGDFSYGSAVGKYQFAYATNFSSGTTYKLEWGACTYRFHIIGIK